MLGNGTLDQGLLRREAEGLVHQVTERRGPAIRYCEGEVDKEEEVCLRVLESDEHLRPFPLSVFLSIRSGLISYHTCSSHALLASAKPQDFSWCPEHEEGDDAQKDSKSTEEEGNSSPCMQTIWM